MRASMERVEDVMEYPADRAEETETPKDLDGAQKLSGDIVLENISFGYKYDAAAADPGF